MTIGFIGFLWACIGLLLVQLMRLERGHEYDLTSWQEVKFIVAWPLFVGGALWQYFIQWKRW